MPGSYRDGPGRRRPRERETARLVAFGLIGLLVIFIGQACVVIGEELAVSRAERRSDIQTRALASGEAGPVVVLPPRDDGYPVRARLLDALVLARQAESAPSPAARRRDLDHAAHEVAFATAARPHWGEAWAIAAFIDTLRGESYAMDARRAFVRSYVDAGYLRYAAPWRVRYGFTHWAELDLTTRRRLIEEAVWLSQVDPGTRGTVFALARRSGGYAPFMVLWLRTRPDEQRPAGIQRRAP